MSKTHKFLDIFFSWKVFLAVVGIIFFASFVSANSDFNMSKYTEAVSNAFSGLGNIAGFFTELSFSGGELIAIVFGASVVIGIIVFIFMRILSRPK